MKLPRRERGSRAPAPDAARDAAGAALSVEAERFSRQDNHARRELVWSAIPYFRDRIAEQLDVGAAVARQLSGREHAVALTLACGDMAGEYQLLRRAGVAEIDAFDISEGQRDKFRRDVYDGAIPVNYRIADVNTIALTPDRYDVV